MSKKIESPHIPSWPPNWKQATDYDFPRMGKEWWSWQFLRRNRKYQENYKLWLCASQAGDTKEETQQRTNIKDCYLISRPIDPSKFQPENLGFFPRGPKRTMGYGSYGVEPDRILISFDAGINFSRQLVAAERLFNQAVSEKPIRANLQRASYPDYLRRYDANTADASRDEIIELIYHGKDVAGSHANSDKYLDHLKEGQRLVDDLGYITSILSTR